MNTQSSEQMPVRIKRRSKIALASMVLGIISPLLSFLVIFDQFAPHPSWFPSILPYFLGIFLFLLPACGGIAAIILGMIALYSIKKRQLTGRWEAILRLVLGAVTTVFWSLFFLLVSALAHP
ncbi:DUF4190 domain-containing protein [Chloroflexota bacterium]